MAIRDFFAAFNPLDVVTGYERGSKRAEERQRHEEDLRRQQLLNTILEQRDVPAAALLGAQTGVQTRALQSRLPQQERAAGIRLGIEESSTERQGSEEQMNFATAPQRIAQQRARREAGTSPQATEELIRGDVLARRGAAAQAESGALNYEGLLAEQKSASEAQRALQGIVSSDLTAERNDPTQRRADPWDQHTRAIEQAPDPRAQQLLSTARDRIAVEALTGAARNGDAETMNLYLKRYGRNQEIERVDSADQYGNRIFQWQLYDIQAGPPDAQGNPTAQRVPVPGGRYEANPNAGEAYIGNLLPDILGFPRAPQGRGGARAAPRPAAAPRPVPVQRPAAAPRPTATPTEAPGAAGAAAAGVSAPQRPQMSAQPQATRSAADMDRLRSGIQSLDATEQRVAQALAGAAKGLDALLATTAGNTEGNRRARDVLLAQIDQMLTKPPAAPRPQRVVGH